MNRRTSTLVILAIVLAATLVLETDAKKSSNQTDQCYKPCRVKSTPVCGNDGRNYSTGCHLSVARCKARKIGQRIYAVNTGYCQSSKPVSQCRLTCTDRREPLCASDKQTYKNLCLFFKAKCERRKRKGTPITVVSRKGPCGKETKCRPLASCPKVKRTVCGSDKKNYTNICHLHVTNCRLKRKAKGKKYKKLTLKHCGPCGRGKQCAAQKFAQKCPEVKFCDQLLRAAVRYAETKQDKSKSLKKDSTGKKQRVTRLPKKKNTDKPKNKKKTSSKKKNLKKPVPNLKSDRKSKTSKKPAKISPKKINQVCGSDGKTYPSVCHLQVAQCTRLNRCQRLQMKHKGACKKRVGKT